MMPLMPPRFATRRAQQRRLAAVTSRRAGTTTSSPSHISTAHYHPVVERVIPDNSSEYAQEESAIGPAMSDDGFDYADYAAAILRADNAPTPFPARVRLACGRFFRGIASGFRRLRRNSSEGGEGGMYALPRDWTQSMIEAEIFRREGPPRDPPPYSEQRPARRPARSLPTPQGSGGLPTYDEFQDAELRSRGYSAVEAANELRGRGALPNYAQSQRMRRAQAADHERLQRPTPVRISQANPAFELERQHWIY